MSGLCFTVRGKQVDNLQLFNIPEVDCDNIKRTGFVIPFPAVLGAPCSNLVAEMGTRILNLSIITHDCYESCKMNKD
jgi:hypothetical protein